MAQPPARDIYEVELSDGRIVEVEADHEPTIEEVLAVLPRTPAEIARESPVGQDLRDLVAGAKAGATNTANTIHDLIRRGMGLPGEAPPRAQAPASIPGALGHGLEQMGEFVVAGGPVSAATRGAPLLTRMGAEAVLGGSLAELQGHDPTTGAALGAAGPAAFDVAAPWLRRRATQLVRAGVKAPLALLNKQAGASFTGLDFQATRLARFIIDHRLATPNDAVKLIRESEREVQQLLARRGHMLTDAPQRAQAYLDILERNARQSFDPAHAQEIRAAAAEMLTGRMGQDVTTLTGFGPHPTLRGANKQPLNVVPQYTTTRQLRPGMPAQEALEGARATSRFETFRQWGERKGLTMEATKAIERAARDAVKDVIPEIRTPLQQEGQAILARTVLDRSTWREGNRDVASLPGLVGAASSTVLGVAAHWLRNNQRRAGVWADDLSRAIANQDALSAATILRRLGVGFGSQVGDLLMGDPQPPQ